MLDVRSRFPGLAREVDGRRAVFADAPGGTQVPDVVIEAMAGYLSRSNANEGGAFATSEETDAVIAGAREATAAFLGTDDPDEVVFGPNMTTLNFALSRSISTWLLRPSDEVVVTGLDHDANVAPWLMAARDAGSEVRWVDLDVDAFDLDLGSLERAVGPQTRVVAFTLASNALGTVTAADEVVARVRAAAPDAIVVADAVHFAQHRLIDVSTLGVDVLYFSPYKVFGPHLGVMWLRRELLERWIPYKVRPAPDTGPHRWETGTANHEGLAAWSAAVAYLTELASSGEPGTSPGPPLSSRQAIVDGFAAIVEHESVLAKRFLDGIGDVPGLRLYGRTDERRTPTFAVRLDGWSPRELAAELGRRGVFVWDGNYYALEVMQRLGLEDDGGAVRIGFCHYNDEDDVERTLDELRSIAGSR